MSALFYRQLGKGFPIILIHGFCETHEIWHGFADELAKSFEIFVIDLPGFGKSPLPFSPFSIDDVGAIVAGWIDKTKIEHPVVIGHSLGGYVTLAMAKRNPEKFAGIGLFQSTAYPDSEEKKVNRNKVIDFVKTHGTDPYIDTFVPGLFYDKKHPAIRIVDRIARKTTRETLVAYAQAMRDRSSSIDFIRSYRQPILFLGGEQDGIIPAESIREQGRMASDSSVHLLKNTSNMAMYENREESRRLVENFAMKIAVRSRQ